MKEAGFKDFVFAGFKQGLEECWLHPIVASLAIVATSLVLCLNALSKIYFKTLGINVNILFKGS